VQQQQQQQQQVKHKALKLQLVLSGACIAGKHQHVSARAAADLASGCAASEAMQCANIVPD
jgi:hypothetical protein